MESVIRGLGKLTTLHGSSRQGEPVLMLDSAPERAHTPADLVEMDGATQPAWIVVQQWMDASNPSGTALTLAERFVGLSEKMD